MHNPTISPDLDKTGLEPHPDSLVPTELREDEDYAAWSREYESGRWEARIAEEAALPTPTFIEKLYAEANSLCDSPDPALAWLGEQVAKIADLARHLEATSPEAFEDRRQAMLDSIG